MTETLHVPTLNQRSGGGFGLPATVHALDDVGEGVVEAFSAAFDVSFYEYGFLRRRKVRIERGAFAKTLSERKSFPVMYEHDWDGGPIGHSVEAAEEEKGLRVLNQLYVDDDMPRRVWRAMEAGALTEWSIGFYPKAWRTEQDEETDEEVTVYTEVDLAENSVVIRGANPDTETVSVASERADEIVVEGVRYRVISRDVTEEPPPQASPTEEQSLVPGAERLLSRRAVREAFGARA